MCHPNHGPPFLVPLLTTHPILTLHHPQLQPQPPPRRERRPRTARERTRLGVGDDGLEDLLREPVPGAFELCQPGLLHRLPGRWPAWQGPKGVGGKGVCIEKWAKLGLHRSGLVMFIFSGAASGFGHFGQALSPRVARAKPKRPPQQPQTSLEPWSLCGTLHPNTLG